MLRGYPITTSRITLAKNNMDSSSGLQPSFILGISFVDLSATTTPCKSVGIPVLPENGSQHGDVCSYRGGVAAESSEDGPSS
jgi:hypothetical protein